MMRRSAFLSVVLLATACAEIGGIEETRFDRDKDPGQEDGEAVVRVKPTCPLLVAYVTEWEISRIDDTARLHAFVIATNQGDFSITLSSLAVEYLGDTHAEVEVEASGWSWNGDGSGFRLDTGAQVGLLAPSAKKTLSEMIELSSENTAENLLTIEICRWLAAAEDERTVSAEIVLTINGLQIGMPMRFVPGYETRPLYGAYACAVDI